MSLIEQKEEPNEQKDKALEVMNILNNQSFFVINQKELKELYQV